MAIQLPPGREEGYEGFVELRFVRPDGSRLHVYALSTHLWNLSLLPPWQFNGTYDDQWQYKSRDAAIEAALEWDEQPEPTGWFRHYATGRRRPDGDPEKEYVQW